MKLILVTILTWVLVSCTGSKNNAQLFATGEEIQTIQNSAFDAQKKYEELMNLLQEEIAARIAGDSNLQGQIDALNTRIDALEYKVDDHISNYNSQITLINKKFKEVYTYIENNYVTKAEYNAFVAQVTTQINTINQQILDMQNTYVTISDYQQFQELMMGRVDGLDAYITELKARTDQQDSKLDYLYILLADYEDVKAKVAQNCVDIKLLNVSMAEFRTEINQFKGDITDRITKLEALVGGINVAELYNNVKNIQNTQQTFLQNFTFINEQILFLGGEITRIETAYQAGDASLLDLLNQLRIDITIMIEQKTEIYANFVAQFETLINHFGSVEALIAQLNLIEVNQINIQNLMVNMEQLTQIVTNNSLDIANLEVEIEKCKDSIADIQRNCAGNLTDIIKDHYDVNTANDVFNLWSNLVGTLQYTSNNQTGSRYDLFLNYLKAVLTQQVGMTDAKATDFINSLGIKGDYANIADRVADYKNEMTNLSHVVLGSMTTAERNLMYKSFKTHMEASSCSQDNLDLTQQVPGFYVELGGFDLANPQTYSPAGTVHEYFMINWLGRYIGLDRNEGDENWKLFNKTCPLVNQTQVAGCEPVQATDVKLFELYNAVLFNIDRGDSQACIDAVTKWEDVAFMHGATNSCTTIDYNGVDFTAQFGAFNNHAGGISQWLTTIKNKIEAAGYVMDQNDEFVAIYSAVFNAFLVEGSHFDKYEKLLTQFETTLGNVPGDHTEFIQQCVKDFDVKSLEGRIAQNNQGMQELLSLIWGSSLFDGFCPEAQTQFEALATSFGSHPIYCGGDDPIEGCGVNPPDPTCNPLPVCSVDEVKHGFHVDLGMGTNLCNGTDWYGAANPTTPTFNLNNKCLAISRSSADATRVANWADKYFMFSKVENCSVIKINAKTGPFGCATKGTGCNIAVGESGCIDLVNKTGHLVNANGGIISSMVDDGEPTVSLLTAQQNQCNQMTSATAHYRIEELFKKMFNHNKYMVQYCFEVSCHNSSTSDNNLCDNADIVNDNSDCAPVTYCGRMKSPIVLDFGHAGYKTVPIQEGVMFDLDADGIKDQTGWIAPNSKNLGFLALDLNNNGKIDNGSELFGNGTMIEETNTPAENGYSALAQYDTNKDGKISSSDQVFSKLKVWFDLNKNGIVDAGEMEALSDRGVASINVDYKKSDYVDGFAGNHFLFESSFQLVSGKELKSYDIFFATGFKAIADKN